MKKRLFYFTGIANDKKIGNYIQLDFTSIKKIYETYEDEGEIILRTDEIITTQLLTSRLLSTSDNYPWLFYYSGHSSKQYIKFEKPLDIKTFVNLFRDSNLKKELKLVFLNSCESYKAGLALLKEGVNCVLMSKEKIYSPIAYMASQLFLAQLMTSDTISEAFERAKSVFFATRSNFDYSSKKSVRPEFPFEIKSQSETFLEDQLPQTTLSEIGVLKSQERIKNVELDLQMKFIEHGKTHKIPVNKNLIQKNIKKSNYLLGNSLSEISKNVDSYEIIKVFGESSIVNLPSLSKNDKEKHILIESLKDPEGFRDLSKASIRNSIEKGNQLLTSLEELLP